MSNIKARPLAKGRSLTKENSPELRERKSFAVSKILASDTRISEDPSHEDLDSPNANIYQASSIDPDHDDTLSSIRTKPTSKMPSGLPKIFKINVMSPSPSNSQETPPIKQSTTRSKNTYELRDKTTTDRAGIDTLSLSSCLNPRSHFLFAPSDMSVFTRSSNKNSLLSLPNAKVNQQELLMSQIAPSSLDFIRSLALHGGTLKNPFEDTLHLIKQDVIRNIRGLNRPKRRKIFRENFESSKYLCNIIKREQEAIQKYAMARESSKKPQILKVTKDARAKAVSSEEQEEKKDWYDWVDSFQRVTTIPEKSNKTPVSRSPNKNVPKLNMPQSNF